MVRDDHNVIDYSMNPDKYYSILGKKDLVYSIGLADYLPERVLKRLILFSFNLLKENGKIIIAHKDSKAYKPLAPDWWCDWKFYRRSEEEVIDIFKNCGIKDYAMHITHEPSNVIFFVIIKRS